ncbi:MAG: hypothetical protein A2X83_08375 [Desulfuromonadales bacterium GWD2_54_10]|nr:MAG: hypothetical protein A2X83_08375 [Desulfuromonadales bacterium GWD2_54_10]
MKFTKITMGDILSELEELPSSWMDETARLLVESIDETLVCLGNKRPTREDLRIEFLRQPNFLDICRLFFGHSQETVAHMICEQLGGKSMGFVKLRSLAQKEPEKMAAVMEELELPDLIFNYTSKKWTTKDILIERYKMSRGRAIAGQSRGRGLEDEVQNVLSEKGIPFQRGVTFTGKKGQTAKCDFCIPTKDHPKIVLEAKGFEATGSKLTDFLGDVLKIGRAKEFQMYFFVVTDGRGWHNRQSDLKKLVEFHEEGLLDMIYTRARLHDLVDHVKQIYENE